MKNLEDISCIDLRYEWKQERVSRPLEKHSCFQSNAVKKSFEVSTETAALFAREAMECLPGAAIVKSK